MEPKRLLVVDDDESVCRLMSAMLEQRGYEVVIQTDPRKVMGMLRDGDFDVALLDVVMPELDGLELIEEIRKHFSVLPILVVTAHGSAETTVAAMQRGATDFATKPVDASLLDLRIRRVFDLEHARRMANTDGLTGLYNHRHLQERLLQEIERAERYERPLSLVMADLDRFKAYNDTYGHPRGDEVLIQVSNTLRQVSRASDIVARYGGEEFTIVLPEAATADAVVVAERARECVGALGFETRTESGVTPVTLSLGVASHVPGSSKEELIEAADAALYRAKNQGRDRVCLAEKLFAERGYASEPGLPLPVS